MRATTRFYSVLSNIKNNPVLDLVTEKTFQISLNGEAATVDYERTSDDIYNLIHTSIPEKYQGQGLGTIFAERIFDHLATHNKKFKLTCEFLQKIHQHNGRKYEMYIVDT